MARRPSRASAQWTAGAGRRHWSTAALWPPEAGPGTPPRGLQGMRRGLVSSPFGLRRFFSFYLYDLFICFQLDFSLNFLLLITVSFFSFLFHRFLFILVKLWI